MNNISKWYVANYPKDELAIKIDIDANFEVLAKCLPNVYEYINVYDSLVRERVFNELANRLNVSYDSIYNKWLNQ